MNNTHYRKFDHDLHARSKSDTDFWAQIRRTVGGKSVDEEQIALILSAIRSALDLRTDDFLLDLACGNGALSSQLFKEITGYRGVDFSPRLIEVAERFFAVPPAFNFSLSGAAEYLQQDSDPARYTKVLCYGSFSYFNASDAGLVLRQLNQRFKNVQRVFIGNLPDKKRADKFFPNGLINDQEILDYESAIGIWRSTNEFLELASSNGWTATITNMPANYYAAHYRYDVLLSRS
jgi:cyclopropane fatty-acyl-phospholipid synthase-like methyltransferase